MSSRLYRNSRERAKFLSLLFDLAHYTKDNGDEESFEGFKKYVKRPKVNGLNDVRFVYRITNQEFSHRNFDPHRFEVYVGDLKVLYLVGASINSAGKLEHANLTLRVKSILERFAQEISEESTSSH
jgi:hypothetical protein